MEKDRNISDLLDDGYNVAQFMAFRAGETKSSYSAVIGYEPNVVFTLDTATFDEFIKKSNSGRLNIRTWKPDKLSGNPFIYDVRHGFQIKNEIQALHKAGYNVIINEMIDVNDGGVSGVKLGDIVEIAPGKTPRAVEGGDCCKSTWDFFHKILTTIYDYYDFDGELPVPFIMSKRHRTEFSYHPVRQGYLQQNFIFWEQSELEEPVHERDEDYVPIWPNLFSKFLGDKAFGLLVADFLGYLVPATKVVNKDLPPFEFGKIDESSSIDIWSRTAPAIPVPGVYPTKRGLLPLRTIFEYDQIRAMLYQQGVKAQYSGTIVYDGNGNYTIEGVEGYGDEYMLGKQGLSELPPTETECLEQLALELCDDLDGHSYKIEWASDEKDIYILQLHKRTKNPITLEKPEGIREVYIPIPDFSLESFRKRIEVELDHDPDFMVVLLGDVGIGSHICDTLRLYKIPFRIERG